MDPTATLSQITSAFDSNKAMFATLTRRGFRAVIPSEIAQKMPAIRRFVVVIPTVLCLNEITYLAVAVSEATWTVRADGSIEAIGGHPTIVWDGIEREENSVALVMEKTISIAKANEGENIAIITGSVERAQAPADE
ncbi:hypothetical protein LRC39_01785 [Rhodopseudomonas sp. P1]|uniref:hypothetical protein n=1 Tax=Rhodopseudomonas sp. P1 TaxID=3434357 RepID=UPI0031FCF8A0